MTEKTKKTIEDYERLAARLAEDRDGARDAAARLARENKVLKQELVPLLERVSEQLGGDALAPAALVFEPGYLPPPAEIERLEQHATWYRLIASAVNGQLLPAVLAHSGDIPEEVAVVLGLIAKSKLINDAPPRLVKKSAKKKKARRR